MTPGKSLVEKRRPLTRVEIITLAVEQGGRCGCGCGEKLDATKERVIDEHVIPLELTGTNDLSNRALYRKPCAAKKTTADAAAIAKAKRRAGETGQGPRREIPTRVRAWPPKGSRPLGTSKRTQTPCANHSGDER
jgi:hypothetical protein